MSADKYQGIFSRQMRAIVYVNHVRALHNHFIPWHTKYNGEQYRWHISVAHDGKVGVIPAGFPAV